MAATDIDANIPESCPWSNGYILDYGDGTFSLEFSGFNYTPQARDPYYTIHDYDTLSNIAFTRYGDSKWYWVLAWGNQIINPFELEVGSTIIIPDLEVVKLALQ